MRCLWRGTTRKDVKMIDKFFDWLFPNVPTNPTVQVWVDRDMELRRVRLNLLLTLGREPTANEIWNESPPS